MTTETWINIIIYKQKTDKSHNGFDDTCTLLC